MKCSLKMDYSASQSENRRQCWAYSSSSLINGTIGFQWGLVMRVALNRAHATFNFFPSILPLQNALQGRPLPKKNTTQKLKEKLICSSIDCYSGMRITNRTHPRWTIVSPERSKDCTQIEKHYGIGFAKCTSPVFESNILDWLRIKQLQQLHYFPFHYKEKKQSGKVM